MEIISACSNSLCWSHLNPDTKTEQDLSISRLPWLKNMGYQTPLVFDRHLFLLFCTIIQTGSSTSAMVSLQRSTNLKRIPRSDTRYGFLNEYSHCKCLNCWTRDQHTWKHQLDEKQVQDYIHFDKVNQIRSNLVLAKYTNFIVHFMLLLCNLSELLTSLIDYHLNWFCLVVCKKKDKTM